MTTNIKVVWGVVVIVLVALVGYLIHTYSVQNKEQAQTLQQLNFGSSSTPSFNAGFLASSSTASGTPTAAKGSGASVSVKPKSPPPPPGMAADGTVTFEAPNTITIALGKSAVETSSGFRVTLEHLDGKVATIRIYTGSCANGYCTSREDQGQNVQFSADEPFIYDGFAITMKSLTASQATFTVAPEMAI